MGPQAPFCCLRTHKKRQITPFMLNHVFCTRKRPPQPKTDACIAFWGISTHQPGHFHTESLQRFEGYLRAGSDEVGVGSFFSVKRGFCCVGTLAHFAGQSVCSHSTLTSTAPPGSALASLSKINFDKSKWHFDEFLGRGCELSRQYDCSEQHTTNNTDDPNRVICVTLRDYLGRYCSK